MTTPPVRERDALDFSPTPGLAFERLVPCGALEVAGAAEWTEVVPIIVVAVAIDVIDFLCYGDNALVMAEAAERFIRKDGEA